jgi:hypothetical protein
VADPLEKTEISLDEVDEVESSSVELTPSELDQDELLGAIRALSAQVGGLQSELQSLRSQGRTALPPAGSGTPGWDDNRAPVQRETSAWIRSLDGPIQRAPAIPRLFLEIVFLVAVAVACVIAELDTFVVILLMGGSWGLVALAEWLAAREAKQQAELALRPLSGMGGVLADDPSWFKPPVERKLAPVSQPAEDDEDTQDGLPLP